MTCTLRKQREMHNIIVLKTQNGKKKTRAKPEQKIDIHDPPLLKTKKVKPGVPEE